MIRIAGRRDSYLEMLETAQNTCAYAINGRSDGGRRSLPHVN